MPELPDLTIYRENLATALVGDTVSIAQVYDARRVGGAGALPALIAGQKLTSIERNGKELFFSFENGACFSVHLMLTGEYHLCPPDPPAVVDGRLLGIAFAGGAALCVSDAGGRARVNVSPKHPGVPDALSEAFTREYYEAGLRRNAVNNIKALLIDQQFVRGIGNAYADEILYAARVSPHCVVGHIPRDAQLAIYAAIPEILRWGIERIRAISPGIIRGEERSFLRVHIRDAEFAENGQPILTDKVAGRHTYYAQSQKLYMG